MEIFHDQAEGFFAPLFPKSGDIIDITVQARSAEITSIKLLFSDGLELAVSTKSEYFGYDYYHFTTSCGKNVVKYVFLIELADGKIIRYSALGEGGEGFGDGFIIMPNLKTPEWARGAIWYQIMPDSFFNGDFIADKTTSGGNQENAWGCTHFGGSDYYGGDLKGIIGKIPYLKRLGVNVVSINPIWLTTHQAGYGAYDPTQVDSAFGNEDSLVELKEELSKNGIKLVLDGVFQYFNNNGVWYNESKYFPIDESAFYDMFLRDIVGNIIHSPWNAPLLDFSSKQLREAVFEGEDSIFKTYLKPPYNCDGWRLDVGNIWEGSDTESYGISEDILKAIHDNIKQVSEDKLILTEHDCGDMMENYTLDTKWNYDIGWPLRDWVEGKIGQRQFVESMKRIFKLPRQIANCSYNHLTTHDTKRILRHANGDFNRLSAGVLFLMTFVGAPCIYFGDEVGMEGAPIAGMTDAAPVSFSSMEWNRSNWNYHVLNRYTALSQLRAESGELFKYGACKFIDIDEGDKIVIYARFLKGAFALVALSQSNKTIRGVKVSLASFAGGRSFICDYLRGKKYSVQNDIATIDIPEGGTVFTEFVNTQLRGDCRAEGDVEFYDDTFYLYQGSSIQRQVFDLFEFKYDGDSGLVCKIDDYALKSFDCGRVIIRRGENNLIETFLNDRIVQSVVFQNLGASVNISLQNGGIEVIKTRLSVKGCGRQLSARYPILSSGMFDLNKNIAVTSAVDGDFTFRGQGMVFCGYDIDNCVKIHRRDGRIAISKVINGYEARINEIEDNGYRLLQLEKAGARYRGVCIAEDDSRAELGRDIFANFSHVQCGVDVESDTAMFGDGNNIKAYSYSGACDIALSSNERRRQHVKYISECGQWEHVFSGLIQRSAQYSCLKSESDYDNFKLDFTYDIVETADSDYYIKCDFTDGYLLLSETRCSFYYNDELIKAVETVGYAGHFGTRAVVERHNCGYNVYLGNEHECVISFACGGKISRPIRIQSFGCRYKLLNYNIFYESGNMAFWRGDYTAKKEGLMITTSRHKYSYFSFTNIGFGDVIFAANLKLAKSASAEEAFFAVEFGGDIGRYMADCAVRVKVDLNRIISICDNENTFAEYTAEGLDFRSFYMVIKKRAANICVSVANSVKDMQLREIIRLVTDKNYNGGVSVYLANATAVLSHTELTGDFEGYRDSVTIDKGRYMWVE